MRERVQKAFWNKSFGLRSHLEVAQQNKVVSQEKDQRPSTNALTLCAPILEKLWC